MFNKTREEARKLWVDALRNGGYSQGTGRLCEVNGNTKYYCCLGVACDLYCKNESPIESHYNRYCMAYDGEDMILPDEVMDWLGIAESDGSYDEDNPEANLAHMNDHGMLFEDIADFIENTPTLWENE